MCAINAIMLVIVSGNVTLSPARSLQDLAAADCPFTKFLPLHNLMRPTSPYHILEPPPPTPLMGMYIFVLQFGIVAGCSAAALVICLFLRSHLHRWVQWSPDRMIWFKSKLKYFTFSGLLREQLDPFHLLKLLYMKNLWRSNTLPLIFAVVLPFFLGAPSGFFHFVILLGHYGVPRAKEMQKKTKNAHWNHIFVQFSTRGHVKYAPHLNFHSNPWQPNINTHTNTHVCTKGPLFCCNWDPATKNELEGDREKGAKGRRRWQKVKRLSTLGDFLIK